MSRRVILPIAFTLIVIGAFASANADSWLLPKKNKYYSPNKNYYLEVTPKKLESQLKYFEGKVGGRNNAGALKGVKDNRPTGAFYVRRADGGYSRKWEFPLVNEVAPVSALVSNSGNHVVTFDNWHGMGYGDDVVVIYRSDGVLVKKSSLEDLLTEGDIETLPHSVSSIWWGGAHYIDDANGLLVLKVVSNGKDSWDEGAKFQELRIELATGRPLEQKRDLFPQLRVFGSVDTGTAQEPSDASPSKPVCSSAAEGSFDSPEAVRIPSDQLHARAKESPLPPYPPLAKAARVESTVVVEVLVSAEGDVVCARSLSGHALLRQAGVAAVLKWKFEPIEVSGKSVKAVGTVALNFKLTEKDMNPNSQGQSNPLNEAEQAVREMERMYRDAIMQQDVGAVSRILADDFIATSSRGERRDKAKEIDDIRPSPDFRMEAFSLDDIHVRIFVDTAIVTGRSTLQVAFKGQSSTSVFRYTRVYVKRNERWQAVAQQLTRVPQQ